MEVIHGLCHPDNHRDASIYMYTDSLLVPHRFHAGPSPNGPDVVTVQIGSVVPWFTRQLILEFLRNQYNYLS